MVLPEPVLSDDDIKVALEVIRNPASVMSSIWSKDPTKLAVLRALASFQARVSPGGYSSWDLTYALAQKWVCCLHSYSLQVEEVHYYPLFRSLTSVLLSRPCPDIQISGGHLLAMFQRITSSWSAPIQYRGPSGASCGVMHAKRSSVV